MDLRGKRIIGLTGGIASGKSTVSRYLSDRYHLPIYDADIIARQAVEINSPIFNNIVAHFGQEILDNNGSLNRSKLGKIIFHNIAEKQWLEQQIHPFVYDYFKDIIEQSDKPVIVFVIPLLFEAKMTDLVSEIWVIDCSFEQMCDRLMNRNKLSLNDALARINSQMPLAEKVKQADAVLNNRQNINQLFTQVDRLMSSKLNKN